MPGRSSSLSGSVGSSSGTASRTCRPLSLEPPGEEEGELMAGRGGGDGTGAGAPAEGGAPAVRGFTAGGAEGAP